MADSHPTKDEMSQPEGSIVLGCSNHGCVIRWPPKPKGALGSNAICKCVSEHVRDGKWLELYRAFLVRNVEIEHLRTQVEALLRERQENSND